MKNKKEKITIKKNDSVKSEKPQKDNCFTRFFNNKKLLLKIAVVALYVLCPILFVLAASLYSLGGVAWPIVLVVLALVSLYGGIFLDAYRKKKFNIQPKDVPQPVEKPKKPFFKRCNVIVLIVAFCMIFVSGFAGMCFETAGFNVSISSFTLTKEMTEKYNHGMINGKSFVMGNDTTYSVTMYKPKTATEENKAPVVFVMPGFTRTKATMSQYCIELARRGAVVFCSDPGGQGDTTETSTSGANGVEYLVQYVYNNTDDFKFCDKNRFGAMGHSAGGGNVCTLAADMAGDDYESSVIKALYVSGYIKKSSANKYENLHCNFAMSYALYDEGVFRYQSEYDALETVVLMFYNNVNGKNTHSYTEVEIGKEDGSMADGTYRVFYREEINHCFQMYDKTSIANTINFFDSALSINSNVAGTNQIWFGKEFFNGLALASGFTFIIALCFVLMDTKFFATIKPNKSVAVSEWEARRKPRSVGKKCFFWTALILSAAIACLDYIPLAHLSVQIFPTSNRSDMFTFVFPARMINAILLWAVVNGLVGLAIYFGEMLFDNLIQKIKAKKNGTTPEYNWSKIEPMKIGGHSVGGAFANVGKVALLCLIMIGAFYLTDWLSYLMFHQDFRFMLISASIINWRMFVTAIEYIPLILIFYFANAIRVNGSIAREGYNETKTMVIAALANSIGLAFMLLINYVCFFNTGMPFYGYWGKNVEVWLYINMVFSLVVMMFILPLFNRIIYRKTGSIWVGAIVWCTIFVMMTITASVSYIPLY